MGTNPFDDEEESNPSYHREINQQYEVRNKNPFETTSSSSDLKPFLLSDDIINEEHSLNFEEKNELAEDPIWAARSVEWPIPSHLSSSIFNQLFKTSHALMNSGNLDSGLSEYSNKGDADNIPAEGAQANAGGYTNSIAGLMSRVLNNSNAASNITSDINSSDTLSLMKNSEEPTQLFSPNAKCVAASNGWIVTLTECTSGIHVQDSEDRRASGSRRVLRVISRWNVYRGTISASGGMGKQSTGKGLLGEKGETLFPLPHALTDFNSNGNFNNLNAGSGSIAGVFVDPTGCHIFISAYNGEAYYLHSNYKQVRKLPGFGPRKNDSDVSHTPTGSRNTKSNNPNNGKGVQSNAYITAVAWDKERGTEGNSKRILLGTNLGEIYEYSLAALDGEDQVPSQDKNSNPTLSFVEEDLKVPVLLHTLNPPSSQSLHHTGSPSLVSGIFFERNQGSIIILAVTSGNNKHTLLHTFRYQAPNTTNASSTNNTVVSFQSVFSSLSPSNTNVNINSIRSNHSVTSAPTETYCNEVGGSIDFADLKVCQDAFMVRTGTGIYFGNIKRTGNYIPKNVDNTSNKTKPQLECGIIEYSSFLPPSTNPYNSQKIPVAIALTPHHFITLCTDGMVTFVNRISRKPIQNERVNYGYNNGGKRSSLKSNSANDTNPIMELMMDVRRPDQVWLRNNQTLVHINSSQEDRDVWKYTLEKSLESIVSKENLTKHYQQLNSPPLNMPAPASSEEKLEDVQFEIAKSQCSNSTQKAVVGLVRAEFHLARGRSDIAAKHFAQSPPKLAPFSSTGKLFVYTTCEKIWPCSFSSFFSHTSFKSSEAFIAKS